MDPIRHEFLYVTPSDMKSLYVPECPIPLQGCDRLSKWRTIISLPSLPLGSFVPDLILTLTIPQEEQWCLHQPEMPEDHNPEVLRDLFPEIWTEDSSPGLAISYVPLVINLCPNAILMAAKQYPVS